MAREYRVGVVRGFINRLVTAMTQRGKGDPRVHLLTTVGRKTGRERTTPVTIMDLDGRRWLVAPYGPVGWVHNIRATARATLSRAGNAEEIEVVEASATEAAPVLAHYLRTVPIVRPFFDVNADSELDEFEREAARHPVFRIS